MQKDGRTKTFYLPFTRAAPAAHALSGGMTSRRQYFVPQPVRVGTRLKSAVSCTAFNSSTSVSVQASRCRYSSVDASQVLGHIWQPCGLLQRVYHVAGPIDTLDTSELCGIGRLRGEQTRTVEVQKQVEVFATEGAEGAALSDVLVVEHLAYHRAALNLRHAGCHCRGADGRA